MLKLLNLLKIAEISEIAPSWFGGEKQKVTPKRKPVNLGLPAASTKFTTAQIVNTFQDVGHFRLKKNSRKCQFEQYQYPFCGHNLY